MDEVKNNCVQKAPFCCKGQTMGGKKEKSICSSSYYQKDELTLIMSSRQKKEKMMPSSSGILSLGPVKSSLWGHGDLWPVRQLSLQWLWAQFKYLTRDPKQVPPPAAAAAAEQNVTPSLWSHWSLCGVLHDLRRCRCARRRRLLSSCRFYVRRLQGL